MRLGKIYLAKLAELKNLQMIPLMWCQCGQCVEKFHIKELWSFTTGAGVVKILGNIQNGCLKDRLCYDNG